MSDFCYDMSLQGKYILVTGACGLIGKEICKAIAHYKGNLIVSDINLKACEDFAGKLSKEHGITAVAAVIDINSEESISNFIEYSKRNKIEIYGLVNSAYPRNSQYGRKFENVSLESFKENLELQLSGCFNITQKISALMAQNKSGSIVNIGSIYGILGPDFSIYRETEMTMPVEYSAVKGGVINLTRYLATYFGRYGVRVNCVSPGGVKDRQPDNFIENYSSKVPLGRMGNPEEMAGAVVFLLSGLSSYITGQNIVIDGGWSAW